MQHSGHSEHSDEGINLGLNQDNIPNHDHDHKVGNGREAGNEVGNGLTSVLGTILVTGVVIIVAVVIALFFSLLFGIPGCAYSTGSGNASVSITRELGTDNIIHTPVSKSEGSAASDGPQVTTTTTNMTTAGTAGGSSASAPQPSAPQPTTGKK